MTTATQIKWDQADLAILAEAEETTRHYIETLKKAQAAVKRLEKAGYGGADKADCFYYARDHGSDGAPDNILENLERLRECEGDLGKWVYLFCRHLWPEGPIEALAIGEEWGLEWYAALHDYMSREGLSEV